MPTNWKKNNPGLVSLSCWLAFPSHCGGCSCLLDRDLDLFSSLSCSKLDFANIPCLQPHPSYQRESPGIQARGARKEQYRTTKCMRQAVDPVLPKHPGTFVLSRGNKSGRWVPTHKLSLPGHLALKSSLTYSPLLTTLFKPSFRFDFMCFHLFVTSRFFTFSSSSGHPLENKIEQNKTIWSVLLGKERSGNLHQELLRKVGTPVGMRL